MIATTEKLTLSITQTAAMLGISRGLAYSLAKSGQLPGVIRLGGKRLVVSRVALERLLQGNGNETSKL